MIIILIVYMCRDVYNHTIDWKDACTYVCLNCRKLYSESCMLQCVYTGEGASCVGLQYWFPASHLLLASACFDLFPQRHFLPYLSFFLCHDIILCYFSTYVYRCILTHLLGNRDVALLKRISRTAHPEVFQLCMWILTQFSHCSYAQCDSATT